MKIVDQSSRILALDPKQSFLVQAPAGSGKTTLLVQRFLTLLATVEQDPEEIIAITFTRKAAAEMRSKILDALQDATDPIARRALDRDAKSGWNILQNPARLKITTIDGFCMSIATQLPVLSQFGAQPQIADNLDLLYTRAVDQLFATENLILNKLLLHLDNDRSKTKKLLISMLKIRDQWLPLLAREDFLHQLGNSLEILHQENISAAIEQTPEIFDPGVFIDQEPTDYADWVLLANRLLTKDGAWRRTLTAAQGFAAPSAAKNKDEKLLLQERKEFALAMLENLQDYTGFRQRLHNIQLLPDQYYTDQQWEILCALSEVLKLLAAQLIVVFKECGQVDYTEVLLAALRAVEQEDAILQALDHKLAHILIDEFQDTSISQFTLLERLVANWQDDGTKTLFLVGDPMQSIYRFRQAEVGLFLQAKAHGVGPIPLHYLQLQMNFRSTAAIVEWCNRTFSQSFPRYDDTTDGAITYKQATPANNSDQNSAVQCIDPHNEPHKIIEIIQNTPAGKSIAILVRARSHLHAILPELRAAGIAYQGTDLETLYARPVVQDLLALTKALLHLDDRIAWLAILRAPWLGLTLAQLQSIAAYQGTIWQALQANPIQPFCNIIQDALSTRSSKTLDQLVKATWRALGGNACLTTIDEQHASEQYFAFLAQHASMREIYKPGFLDMQLQQIMFKPTAADPNALQILTMHKAKGLEFDVVVIPGLNKAARTTEKKLLLLERRKTTQDYLLVAPIRSAYAQQDNLYEYLDWCEKQREQHETLRLFYVAATRAREKLYCLATLHGETEPTSNSLLATIWPAVQDEFTITTDTTNTVTAIAARKNLVVQTQNSLQRLPHGWHQQHPYNPPSFNNDVSAKPRWQNATDWQRHIGTVVHRALWHIATYGRAHMPDWLEYARQLGIPAQHQYFIQSALDKIQACPHAQKILARNYAQSYAEWPLTICVGSDGETENIIIDRAYLDHDQIFWIIDYKTVLNERDLEPSAHYKQLGKYVAAVQKLKPDLEVRAGLYFVLQARFTVVDLQLQKTLG